MIKKLTLTDDLIKLIKNIRFEAFENGEQFSTNRICDAIAEIESSGENMKKFGAVRDKLVRAKEKLDVVSYQKDCYAWGINQWSLFGGTYVMEDIALILGRYDEFIPGTEESPQGKQYPKELEEYMCPTRREPVRRNSRACALEPGTTTPEPTCPSYHSLCVLEPCSATGEATAMRSPHTAPRE